MRQTGEGWEELTSRIRVVNLGWAVKLLVPALGVSAVPLSTRAVSYEGGKIGFAMGALTMGGSLLVSWLLYPLAGVFGVALMLWLVGSAGVVMMVNGVVPVAFVKVICARCRLLPVIEEHEAIHMAGVGADSDVWKSMKTRYSVESLGLKGDPAVCSFCPIPKRLQE